MSQIDIKTASATVTLADGQVLEGLRIMPGDIAKLERRESISANDLEESMRLGWVLFLLWLSAKRRGYAGELDAWEDAVVDVAFTSGPDAGPGEPAP